MMNVIFEDEYSSSDSDWEMDNEIENIQAKKYMVPTNMRDAIRQEIATRENDVTRLPRQKGYYKLRNRCQPDAKPNLPYYSGKHCEGASQSNTLTAIDNAFEDECMKRSEEEVETQILTSSRHEEIKSTFRANEIYQNRKLDEMNVKTESMKLETQAELTRRMKTLEVDRKMEEERERRTRLLEATNNNAIQPTKSQSNILEALAETNQRRFRVDDDIIGAAATVQD